MTGPVALCVIERHLGPEPLDDGAAFSAHISDRIFRETGVRANYRARKQWRKDKKLTLPGPVDELDKARKLVDRYGRETAPHPDPEPQGVRAVPKAYEDKSVSQRVVVGYIDTPDRNDEPTYSVLNL